MMKRVIALLAALAALAGCGSFSQAPVASQSPQPLKVIVFGGGFNWPIWAAQSKGLFAREGLQVQVTPTPNSAFQLKGLIEEQFDVAMTAIDNLIAYREGQGEAGVSGPDLVAVMGGDNGFLTLVATPEIRSYADLRGKTMGVDALTTGYAFVLMEMLEQNGLKLNADYGTERAGGVAARHRALLEKKFAATMLVSPFEVEAEALGFNRLGNANQTLGRYQGVVAGVRQSWARQNPAKVTGYIRAYADAVEWLYNPANKNEAIGIFMANLPNATREAAETAYRVLLAPANGFQRRAAIDMQGVDTVLRLRGKYASPRKEMGPANRYYDPSFYDAATRGR
jgi:ABC-type nitrate/sulfonate/bicarbonate transport system substrate-binding protein